MAIKDKLQTLLGKVTNKDIKGDNVEEVIADATEKYEGGGGSGENQFLELNINFGESPNYNTCLAVAQQAVDEDKYVIVNIIDGNVVKPYLCSVSYQIISLLDSQYYVYTFYTDIMQEMLDINTQAQTVSVNMFTYIFGEEVGIATGNNIRLEVEDESGTNTYINMSNNMVEMSVVDVGDKELEEMHVQFSKIGLDISGDNENLGITINGEPIAGGESNTLVVELGVNYNNQSEGEIPEQLTNEDIYDAFVDGKNIVLMYRPPLLGSTLAVRNYITSAYFYENAEIPYYVFRLAEPVLVDDIGIEWNHNTHKFEVYDNLPK